MTRTPKNPAAERAPVARRAARASVPGGPAASEPPYGAAGGKTSASPAPQLPGDADSSPAGVPTPRAGGTPAGSTRLRGAEALAAIQRAQSKARRAPAVRKPAATAKAPPPPVVGASLTATARCLSGCDWTAGPGDPGEVDKAAERHTTKPPKHATNLVSVVAA